MAPVTIMIRNNGPYQIEGEVLLVTADGTPVPTTPGKPVKLCRCGASTKKPFCDGMHSKIGFQGAQAAQEAFDSGRNPGAGSQPPAGGGTPPAAGGGAQPAAGGGAQPTAGAGTQPPAGGATAPSAGTAKDPKSGT